MSRKHRVWFPGAMYHITARGNRRTALFERELDYQTYLLILEDVRKQYPFELHSYCLMTNHIHLLLETKNIHISDIMKAFHSRYAIWFNKEYDYIGHLFQGRYGAKLITDAPYFLEVSRYIHLNPLDANMVDKPEQYRWSSYRTYLSHHQHHQTSLAHVTTSKILSFFPEPKEVTYKKYVEEKLEQS